MSTASICGRASSIRLTASTSGGRPAYSSKTCCTCAISQAVDAIRGQLGRFGPDEAGCRPERPHEKGSTGSPSMASVARTTQRYPGLARIGDASTDGELGPWVDKIGSF
jgi:hypothetical protein